MTTISVLIFPTINFVIFVSIIYFISRKSVPAFFKKKNESVQDLYDRVDNKFREAQLKLKNHQDKYNNVESEKRIILKNSEKEIASFGEEYRAETKRKIERMEVELDENLASERQMFYIHLKEELLQQMIAKTVMFIRSSGEHRGSITKKMLELIK